MKLIKIFLMPMFIMISVGQVRAQLSCEEKGYFYFKAYDPHSKTFYISNILKGDAYWCVDGKKRYADDKKVEFFRAATKAKDSKANPIMNYIVPNNSGRNVRNGELLANDYTSVKKEYDLEISRTKSPDKIVKIVLDEKDFQ